MAAGVSLSLMLVLSACGGKESKADAENTAAEASTAEASDLTETEAPAETEETTAPETAQAAEQSESQAEMPDPIETDETYPGTLAASEGDERPLFGVMYATVIEIQKDGDGTTIYNLQDASDPENVWALKDTDIGSIETDLEKGSMAAFLFSGDIIHDSENVFFIAAVPYTTYSLGRVSGVTENNVMSTFTLRTEDGQTLSFLKDNCRIEEGSMRRNAGDAVIVYYAYSDLDNIYYPLQIFADK